MTDNKIIAALAAIIESIDKSGARLKHLADMDAPQILFKREAELISMRVEMAREVLAEHKVSP